MLLHLGIGGHGDCPKKLFSGHKPCYDGQWQLTGHYFKHWLYTISKDFAFQSLCLVPNNVDFVLSCPKCVYLICCQQASQWHKLEKSLISCFSISVPLLSWKYIQVSSAWMK